MRAVILAALGAAPAAAQPAAAVVARGATELSASVAVAHGITILQSTGGQDYVMPALAWGRVLTDPRGPAWARGRFEWALEVTPFFEIGGGRARGAGLAPLAWRWNFDRAGAAQPYVEAGGGALWTSHTVPEGTTGSNFMTHVGGGVRLLAARQHGLVVGYRFHHISNGNRLARNPGVNAHMLTIGWTRLSP